jgi:predicted nuclease of predicted toxin-antitoxin system
MIIWIDAQLSPALAGWITATFADVKVTAVAVRDLGLRDAEDDAIFMAARVADVAVLTKDSDFVELHERAGSPPKVIWLTCGNTSNAALRALLGARLREAVALLEAGESLIEIAG